MFEPNDNYQSPEVMHDENGRVYIVKSDSEGFMSSAQIAEAINQQDGVYGLTKTTNQKGLPTNQRTLDRYMEEGGDISKSESPEKQNPNSSSYHDSLDGEDKDSMFRR